MSVIFATAGKPDSFGKRKFPKELPAYLAEFGLCGFEIEFGRGVRIAPSTVDFFASCSVVRFSVHAPYFISLSSTDADVRSRSIVYIVESAVIAAAVGAERVVVHAGSCAKISREQALELALDTLKCARRELDRLGLERVLICPETMGKVNQLGTLEEVIELCKFDERMLPCVDFGHLNARTHGGIVSREDYAAAFDKVESALGRRRLNALHIHFSKIEFTAGGEKRHLTFEEGDALGFGPQYKPMLDEIAERKISPFIVCESDGTQAEDCGEMAKYYNSICSGG